MPVEQLGQHCYGHMGVDVGWLDSGRLCALDLRAQLGFRGLRHQMPAQARDIAPEEAILIDQPRRLAHR